MIKKWDGHTHTHYCNHGNRADLKLYIERAIEMGFQSYTVSEHPPLPKGWLENKQILNELSMAPNELSHYFDCVSKYKSVFSDRLEISAGLELDYLPGSEWFTLDLLQKYQDRIDDIIISVHYLPGKGGMRCIDYSPHDFTDGLLNYYGSMDLVVDEYYNHLERAIEFAAQLPFRKRIGHINLIEKFHLVLPQINEAYCNHRLNRILLMLNRANVGVDVNTAGLRIKTCKKAYVPKWFIEDCFKQQIPCVFGSDAHKPEDVGYGWGWYENIVKETTK